MPRKPSHESGRKIGQAYRLAPDVVEILRVKSQERNAAGKTTSRAELIEHAVRQTYGPQPEPLASTKAEDVFA